MRMAKQYRTARRQHSREFSRFAEAIQARPVPQHEWFRDLKHESCPFGLDLVMQCRCGKEVRAHVDNPESPLNIVRARHTAFVAHREACGD